MTRERKTREVVIEFERLWLIRKRASSRLQFCSDCAVRTDFISISCAAKLFEIGADVLARTLSQQNVHLQLSAQGGIFVCVGSLLASMKDHGASKARMLIE